MQRLQRQAGSLEIVATKYQAPLAAKGVTLLDIEALSTLSEDVTASATVAAVARVSIPSFTAEQNGKLAELMDIRLRPQAVVDLRNVGRQRRMRYHPTVVRLNSI